jgi:hypothetical protein
MTFGLEGAALGALYSAYVGAAATGVTTLNSRAQGKKQAGATQAAAEGAQLAKTAEQRKSGEELRAAEAEAPDPTAVLQAEQDPDGTMARVGLGGVNADQLRLGMNALLGEGGGYA